jgi:hypothetical protein
MEIENPRLPFLSDPPGDLAATTAHERRSDG